MRRPGKVELTSPQVESAVLGCMLQSRDALDIARRKLDAGHFGDPAAAALFTGISSVADAYPGEVDFAILHDHLRETGILKAIGGPNYVLQSVKLVSDPAKVDEYATRVIRAAGHRSMASIGKRLAELASEEGTQADKAAEVAELVAKLSMGQSDPSSGWKTMVDLSQAYEAEIEAVIASGTPEVGIPTGYPSIDTFAGGLNKTDLVVIGGRTSMGKTSLAMNIVINIARRERRPILVFSLEMQARQLHRRTVATLSGVDANILKRRVPDDEEARLLREGIEQLEYLPIHFFDQSDQSIGLIRAQASRLTRELGGVSAIVVDYLQLVNGGGSSENRTQEVGAVARGLKNLAKELECPVIALAQLGRNLENREDKRPRLSDLRESGSIEAEADQVIFIYRPEYYTKKSGPESDPNRVEEAEIIFAKNRHAAVGSVTLGFQPAYTRFREIERGGYQVPFRRATDADMERKESAQEDLFAD